MRVLLTQARNKQDSLYMRMIREISRRITPLIFS